MTNTNLESQTAVEGTSRGEIIDILCGEGFNFDGTFSLNGEFLNSKLYSNREEAVEDNSGEINPKYDKPFVAIFYRDEDLLIDEIRTFSNIGRLYDSCVRNKIPVEEFVAKYNLDNKQRADVRIASRTLARIEKLLEERIR